VIPPEFLCPYLAVISFIFGACIGSFLNVCVYRIPLEMSVVKPASHCFTCQQPVAWYHNLPILSYLILRGKCRHCGTSYSPRYMLVEVLTGVLYLLVWMRYGGGPDAVVFDPRIPVYWLAISGLVMGTFIDFDHLILPDRVTIGGMIIGVPLSILVPTLHGETTWQGGALSSGIGLVAGFGLLYAVAEIGELAFKKEAMGFGDVKLMGAIGAFGGWHAVFFTVLISSLLGSVVGISLVLLKGREWQSRIPFGPYLALAAVLWFIWGADWWAWYMGFLTGNPA
jgi:leader peptidase (prepilin peptidase)/N-methyltransferase